MSRHAFICPLCKVTPTATRREVCQHCAPEPVEFTHHRARLLAATYGKAFDACMAAILADGFTLAKPGETVVDADWLARLFLLADDATATPYERWKAIRDHLNLIRKAAA